MFTNIEHAVDNEQISKKYSIIKSFPSQDIIFGY